MTKRQAGYHWHLRRLMARHGGGLVIVDSVYSTTGAVAPLEDLVAAPIADGRLIRLLEPWCEPFAGYHLYYPDRQGTTAFKLFKEALRAQKPLMDGEKAG